MTSNPNVAVKSALATHIDGNHPSMLFPMECRLQSSKDVPPPRIAPLKPTQAYDTYWRFAVERQLIFWRRLTGLASPWTNDSILLAHKFTNAYRASDRVSQYLIRHVIYDLEAPNKPEEVVFRILLFKFFNRIETWELFKQTLGQVSFAEFSYDKYNQILTKTMSKGMKIYSAAYIMPSGKMLGHSKKHSNHLTLLERMMKDRLPHRLSSIQNMQQAFGLLRSYPTIGDFLAYQYVTDINYSEVTGFSEMEFVAPGPGAIDGIRKCFTCTGGLSDSEVIKFMTERQEIEFARLGIAFPTLWGRKLQLIDCQNLFCEVSKYARIRHPEIIGASDRSKIKQLFHPNLKPIQYWYPPKWAINSFINPINTSEA